MQLAFWRFRHTDGRQFGSGRIDCIASVLPSYDAGPSQPFAYRATPFMMTARHLLLLLLPLFTLACCGTPEQPSATQTSSNQPSSTQPNDLPTSNQPNAASPAEQPEGNAQPASNPQAHPTATKPNTMTETPDTPAKATTAKHEIATLGNGCFWCTEAVLEQLDGVIDVESGYTGGKVDNPTYKQICTGTTDHAEVVKVTFDPAVISYESLLDWFFRSHNPTTLNRQGNDEGTQYRSAIYFHSEQQHQTALAFMAKIASNWQDPIVTELVPAVKFWVAEDYHQDYFRNNANQGYCRVVIKPKLAKLGLDAEPKK
jgi:peptide-methionine (S)-S-oxide reductase